MFESLTDRLSGVFRNLSGRAQLTESNIQDALREVRLALLEADVNFKIVKEFVDRVREAALGVQVMKGVTPAQQVIQVVHEELVKLLGGEDTELKLQGAQPAVILMVGLQGSGKTTSSGRTICEELLLAGYSTCAKMGTIAASSPACRGTVIVSPSEFSASASI